jgi:putative transposase
VTEALGASKSERSAGRVGHRSGHYNRTLITRVGKLELRVPQDCDGRFSTELFERYQRSEQALVATLAEMYVQGVSIRKVKITTEELCGHSFSASTISSINKRLDESLTAFARRRLDEPFAYLIIDAKYEKVRQDDLGKEFKRHSRGLRRRLEEPPDRLGLSPARPLRRSDHNWLSSVLRPR